MSRSPCIASARPAAGRPRREGRARRVRRPSVVRAPTLARAGGRSGGSRGCSRSSYRPPVPRTAATIVKYDGHGSSPGSAAPRRPWQVQTETRQKAILCIYVRVRVGRAPAAAGSRGGCSGMGRGTNALNAAWQIASRVIAARRLRRVPTSARLATVAGHRLSARDGRAAAPAVPRCSATRGCSFRQLRNCQPS